MPTCTNFPSEISSTDYELPYSFTVHSVSHSLKKGQGAGQKKGTFDA